MATLRKLSYLKFNVEQPTAAKSLFINRERIVTQKASIFTGAALQIEYNSDGHNNSTLDWLEVNLTSDHTGTWIVPTAEVIDRETLDTPASVNIPLWNVVFILEKDDGKARIVYVKRLLAGQPIFGYVDSQETFANIHTTIS